MEKAKNLTNENFYFRDQKVIVPSNYGNTA